MFTSVLVGLCTHSLTDSRMSSRTARKQNASGGGGINSLLSLSKLINLLKFQHTVSCCEVFFCTHLVTSSPSNPSGGWRSPWLIPPLFREVCHFFPHNHNRPARITRSSWRLVGKLSHSRGVFIRSQSDEWQISFQVKVQTRARCHAFLESRIQSCNVAQPLYTVAACVGFGLDPETHFHAFRLRDCPSGHACGLWKSLFIQFTPSLRSEQNGTPPL